MKQIKRITLIAVLLITTLLQGQTKVFNSQVRIKQVPLSSSLDSLVTINSDGLLTYLAKSDLASGGALEFITESGKTGIAIKGRNPANYGNIGLGAVDLSFSSSASTTRGATGDYSLVSGQNNTGGDYSFVSGTYNYGGKYSLVSGQNNTGSIYSLVSGQNNEGSNHSLVSGISNTGDIYSLVSGLDNEGSKYSLVSGQNNTGGVNSLVSGIYNTAPSYSESAMGMYGTDYTPNSTSSYDSGDRLFNLGNGTSDSYRSDALIVYKSGNATLNGDLTVDNIIGNGSQLTNVDAGALEFITEGGNTGIAIKGRNPVNYGDIGEGAVDLSFSNSASTTIGATGNYSLFSGYNNTGGDYSLVSGQYNTGGDHSLVSGYNNTGGLYSLVSGKDNIGGIYSLVSGINNTGGIFSLVSGNNNTVGGYSLVSGRDNTGGSYSLVSGRGNTAPSYAESALGMYGTNYTPISTNSYNANDRLFSLANGIDADNRNDALIVYKSGNATLNGDLTVDNIIGNGSQLTDVIRTVNTSTLQTSATLNSAFPFADNPEGTIVVNKDSVQSFMYIRVNSTQWKAVSLGSII